MGVGHVAVDVSGDALRTSKGFCPFLTAVCMTEAPTVRAGLDDWPMTGLKFHNTSLQLFDFLFLPCNATAETAVNIAQGKSVLGTKSKISRANLL